MIKAFLACAGAALMALLLALVVTAGVAESLSVRQAGQAWLAFVAIEVLTVVASVWGFRRLAVLWSGEPAPAWSWLLLAALILMVAITLGLLGLILLNR